MTGDGICTGTVPAYLADTNSTNSSNSSQDIYVLDGRAYHDIKTTVYLNPQSFIPEYHINGTSYEVIHRWESNGWAGPATSSTVTKLTPWTTGGTGAYWYGPISYSATRSYIYHPDNTWTELEPTGPILTPRERMLKELRSRLAAPTIIHSRNCLRKSEDEREDRARKTLKRIVGERQYLNFLKNGFVTARNPKSGYVYQIFPSNHLTYVYKDGKCVQTLCIYLRGNFPPTDFVITMYLMALNNDERIWEIGCKHGPREKIRKTEPKQDRSLPLVELYKQFKLRATG